MSTGPSQRPNADRLVLVVMAKAPQPGLVKTRLACALGADGAAALAARLLSHTLVQACSARPPTAVTLACAPDAAHPAFLAEQARHVGMRLVVQAAGDLGQRMHHAFLQAFTQADRVLLMGTDAPAIDAAVLRQAGRALLQADAVFVPAHDGGYALIGLRRPAPFLFEKMPWSTAQVMALSRQRLEAVGRRWVELAPVHDIDEPDDLAHLPPDWAAEPPLPEPTEPRPTTNAEPQP